MKFTDQIIERGARALYESSRGMDYLCLHWDDLKPEAKRYWLDDCYIILSATELDLRIHFMETTLNKVPPTATDYLAKAQIHEGPIQTTFNPTKALKYLKDEITSYEKDHIKTQLDAFDDLSHNID